MWKIELIFHALQARGKNKKSPSARMAKEMFLVRLKMKKKSFSISVLHYEWSKVGYFCVSYFKYECSPVVPPLISIKMIVCSPF